jgi:hypothetical protein
MVVSLTSETNGGDFKNKPGLPLSHTTNLNWMPQALGELPLPRSACFKPDVAKVGNVSYLILFDVLVLPSRTT